MVIFKLPAYGNSKCVFCMFHTSYHLLGDTNRYIAADNTQPVRLKYIDRHQKKKILHAITWTMRVHRHLLDPIFWNDGESGVNWGACEYKVGSSKY
jgi:hypothetical protein